LAVKQSFNSYKFTLSNSYLTDWQVSQITQVGDLTEVLVRLGNNLQLDNIFIR